MIEVYRIRLPKDRLCAMPANERALFFLLGYAGNQINMFQKLLIFSTNQTPDEIVEQRITGAHTQMLLRFMIGLLHEAWLLIHRRFLQSPLGRDYVPLLPSLGKEALEQLKTHFGESGLLARLRNEYAFHYPGDDAEVNAAFQSAASDNAWNGDWNFYPSPLEFNSFNFAADLVIIHGMCRVADKSDLVEAQKKIMKEVREVADYLTNFIGGFTDVVLRRHFAESIRAELVREIADAPKAVDVWIPFFVEPPPEVL